MSEKRYAIVRVDYKCPQDLEEDIKRCVGEHCKNCRYGDTKEQLIKKVEQVIKRQSLKGAIWESELAKEIVEFLGVEDGR